MRPTYLLGVAQTPPILGMAGSPSEPMIWDRPKSPTSPRGVIRQVKDMMGTKVCTFKKYLGHDVN